MSDSPKSLPENAPFAQEQKAALNSLIPAISGQQAIWLSGYFAAIAQQLGGAPATTAQPKAAPAAASQPSVPLTVLFGSESGNSETCAEDVAKAADKAGFKTTVVDMGDYDFSKLETEKNVLIVVSTWGEGDPPERAVSFHEFVHSESAPSLKGINYSVCSLGDTSYTDFCECGKQFDKRFEELGANRVLERVDCDVDFEEPFQNWLDAVIPKLSEVAGASKGTALSAEAGAIAPANSGGEMVLPDFAPPVEEPEYGKKKPFPAPIKEQIDLNGRGSAKSTYHLEFSLEGAGLSYEPGDAIGVFPRNCPEVVKDLLRQAGFRGDEVREEADGSILSLAEILEKDYDITSLNPNIIKKYAPLAKNKDLDRFLEEDNKEKLSEYLQGREIRDLFNEYPPAEYLNWDQLLSVLRKMPPRLYSIASSLKAHPDEVHLTVGVVHYEFLGRARKGVCSTFLAERVGKGDTVPLYVHHNKNFFLPEDTDTPIIMVGPGTGIAPFRAFVEERNAIGAKGKNWLFFGDQHFLTDFLYQTEWQSYLKSGILTQMDVAFSRDTDHKVYVQHRMKERSQQLYAWLQEGAYLYVCGDANRMAKDVHDTLIDVVSKEGAMSHEDADAYVRQLQKSKRYQRDVY